MADRNQRKVILVVLYPIKWIKQLPWLLKRTRNMVCTVKRVKYSKKFKAHDENNIAKTGDVVRISETRPLSATKHFRLLEVVEEAVII